MDEKLRVRDCVGANWPRYAGAEDYARFQAQAGEDDLAEMGESCKPVEAKSARTVGEERAFE